LSLAVFTCRSGFCFVLWGGDAKLRFVLEKKSVRLAKPNKARPRHAPAAAPKVEEARMQITFCVGCESRSVTRWRVSGAVRGSPAGARARSSSAKCGSDYQPRAMACHCGHIGSTYLQNYASSGRRGSNLRSAHDEATRFRARALVRRQTGEKRSVERVLRRRAQE
jgi:hypothetical protein